MRNKILLSLVILFLPLTIWGGDSFSGGGGGSGGTNATKLQGFEISPFSPTSTNNVLVWNDTIKQYVPAPVNWSTLTGSLTSLNLANAVTDETGSDALVFGTNPTLTGATVDQGSLVLQGNQSAAAWTTNGIRIKGVSGTLTDTTSSGTVAAAYTNKLGGNTIAASSSTTFTDYISSYFSEPVAGSNVTLTNKWGLGADSLYVGTSNPVKITSAGILSATNATLTTPKIAQINDTNGNTSLAFTATGSAVNYPSWANAATTTSPTLSILGSDTNIGLNITPKGTGTVSIGSAFGTPVTSDQNALAIQYNTNASVGFEFRNSSTGTGADIRYALIDSTGNSLIALMPSTGNTGGTLFGLSRQTSAFFYEHSTGTARALGIGTLGAKSLVLGTSGIAALTLDSSQNATLAGNLKLTGGKLYPASDSTTALQITKADGTTAVGTWDTTNSRLGIGKTPTVALDVSGAGLFSGGLTGTGITAKNGVTATTSTFYGTFTDASNYESIVLQPNASGAAAIFGYDYNGTGNATKELRLGYYASSLTLQIANATALSIPSVSTITGGAGNMTITSGTGNSRTMTLKTTDSGGTATTALTLNADQTLNGNLGRIPQIISVASDVTTTSTTFVDVTGLSFSVVANKKYAVVAHLAVNKNDTTGMQMQLTGPASPTLISFRTVQTTSSSGSFTNDVVTAFSTAGSTFNTFNGDGFWEIPAGLISNGANAGTVQLQIKSITGGTTKVYAGSWIQVTQLN